MRQFVRRERVPAGADEEVQHGAAFNDATARQFRPAGESQHCSMPCLEPGRRESADQQPVRLFAVAPNIAQRLPDTAIA
jgi:hypothetical protein